MLLFSNYLGSGEKRGFHGASGAGSGTEIEN